MKQWVITGSDIEGVRLMSGHATSEQVAKRYCSPYEADEVRLTETSVIAGDFCVQAELVEVRR